LVGQTGKAVIDWQRWFNSLKQALLTTPGIMGSVALRAQASSVATTPIPTPTLSPGLYRITYYSRVTQPATLSSSLELTLSWVDGGVTCSVTTPAVIGNTTASIITGQQIVSIDNGTQVSYATTYSSVGATPMRYTLSIAFEVLP
jgi:hypothetical protein